MSEERAAREGALLAALEATDAYLGAAEALGAALKAGWFSLARAKYGSGAGAAPLGQAAYPGEMRAACRLALTPPSDPDDLYDRFELAAAEVEQPGSSSGAAGERGSDKAGAAAPAAGSGSGAGSSEPSSSGPDEPRAAHASSSGGHGSGDPLRWFGGGLPSSDLRQAQRDFKSALDAVIAAANALQALRGAAEAVADGGGSGDDAAGSDGGGSGDLGGGGGAAVL